MTACEGGRCRKREDRNDETKQRDRTTQKNKQSTTPKVKTLNAAKWQEATLNAARELSENIKV